MKKTSGRQIPDALDVDLRDAELMAEIELIEELIVAATESDGPLSQPDIDRILGVDRSS